MAHPQSSSSPADRDALSIIEQLMSGAELLPEQLPRQEFWSPEKELAAAVLTDALLEVRDFINQPSHKRRLAEELEWIFSDDSDWLFSFVRLCEIFALEPGFVRKTVLSWLFGAVGSSKVSSGRYPAAA